MVKFFYLFKEDHIPEKAAFPVIDAHNHQTFIQKTGK
jgi:hypothetical protein